MWCLDETKTMCFSYSTSKIKQITLKDLWIAECGLRIGERKTADRKWNTSLPVNCREWNTIAHRQLRYIYSGKNEQLKVITESNSDAETIYRLWFETKYTADSIYARESQLIHFHYSVEVIAMIASNDVPSCLPLIKYYCHHRIKRRPFLSAPH